MKKAVFLAVFALVLVIGSMAWAEQTNSYKDRMAFAVEGDLMVYVGFVFTVPSGNCGQVEVREYVPGNSISAIQPHWELLQPGTTAGRGVYWFKSAPTACNPIVEISGQPFDTDVYGAWTGRELEPNDVGILSVKRKNANVFGLSEDDKEYSYNAVFNPFGYKTNLGTILNVPNSFNMGCDDEGVILPGPRGFLNRVVLWKNLSDNQLAVFMKNTIINRDEFFVLVCKEHYSY